MLAVKRKQMAAIGEAQLRNNLADFLGRHVDGLSSLPLDRLDAELDAIIAYCRKAGLRSQRAVASYALAWNGSSNQTARASSSAARRSAARATSAANIWPTSTSSKPSGVKPSRAAMKCSRSCATVPRPIGPQPNLAA